MSVKLLKFVTVIGFEPGIIRSWRRLATYWSVGSKPALRSHGPWFKSQNSHKYFSLTNEYSHSSLLQYLVYSHLPIKLYLIFMSLNFFIIFFQILSWIFYLSLLHFWHNTVQEESYLRKPLATNRLIVFLTFYEFVTANCKLKSFIEYYGMAILLWKLVCLVWHLSSGMLCEWSLHVDVASSLSICRFFLFKHRYMFTGNVLKFSIFLILYLEYHLWSMFYSFRLNEIVFFIWEIIYTRLHT